MNKIVICVILPCIIALVASAYIPVQYGNQGVPQYAPRRVAPYYNYARNSFQAVRQARLFNYLLGGLYFLNLLNGTGSRIVG